MKNGIDFQHDERNDIVIVTPHWLIATPADAAAWYGQMQAYFVKFPRKMDVILVLDDVEVKPAAGGVWGEYRAKLHQNLLRFSYRVHIPKSVRLFMNTSAARFNAPTDEMATIEEAILAILAARKRLSGTVSPGPS